MDLGAPERSAATEHLTELGLASKKLGAKEPLYVLAIGALTNVANALLLAPELVEKIVVWLGGHAHHWPHTFEFNLAQDVAAAALVFDSGVPLVQLPCQGVVSRLLTTVPEIDEHVRGQGKIGGYLFKLYSEHKSDHYGWSKSGRSWSKSSLSAASIIYVKFKPGVFRYRNSKLSKFYASCAAVARRTGLAVRAAPISTAQTSLNDLTGYNNVSSLELTTVIRYFARLAPD